MGCRCHPRPGSLQAVTPAQTSVATSPGLSITMAMLMVEARRLASPYMEFLTTAVGLPY